MKKKFLDIQEANNAAFILLFTSMIPLHEDKLNHQMTFRGNVFRLYLDWKES